MSTWHVSQVDVGGVSDLKKILRHIKDVEKSMLKKFFLSIFSRADR
jgi:hypothetical protein